MGRGTGRDPDDRGRRAGGGDRERLAEDTGTTQPGNGGRCHGSAGVDSEGRLRAVIVHRPGAELKRVVPPTMLSTDTVLMRPAAAC